MSATELPAFDKRDLLIIVAFSVACGCLKELLAYVFVYRRPGFKKKFEEVQERFEEYHRTYVLFEPRTANYNCFQDVNKRLLDASNDIRGYQTWYNLINGAIFMLLMLLVMSYFEGCIIAKLPFTPIWPISLFTQGDATGSDVTSCSATCLYTVLSMVSKDASQMFLGYRSPVTTWTEINLKSMAQQEKSS